MLFSTKLRDLTIVLIVLLLSFITFYLVWAIHKWNENGIESIFWHTHLMVYPVLWVLLFIFFLPGFYYKKEFFIKYFTALTSLVLVFFAIEFLFVLSGFMHTYLEKINGHYSSYRNTSQYYHIWNPGFERCLERPESKYCAKPNSLGFIDREWDTLKPENQIRVLALGDSFTEGDGAPFDSSYVAILRNKLTALDSSYYVMNAGGCGSDPFNNFVNLRDKLLPYKPDIILQSISTFDLTGDIAIRGGFDRYQSDGTVKHKETPWWEPIYAISYVSRIFFNALGYNHLLIKESITQQQKEQLDKDIKELIFYYSQLCDKHDINLYFVFRPEKQEIFQEKYNYDFETIKNEFKKYPNIHVLDLLPSFASKIKKRNHSPNDYFWKKDGHHNSLGYYMMTDIIYEEIFIKAQQP